MKGTKKPPKGKPMPVSPFAKEMKPVKKGGK